MLAGSYVNTAWAGPLNSPQGRSDNGKVRTEVNLALLWWLTGGILARWRSCARNAIARRCAGPYQIMFLDLKGDDLKRAREWDLFVRFCEAGGLDVDPAEVDMPDPPFPDLKADVSGRPHFFELGEVVQEDWLGALARHEKAREKRPLGPIESPLPSFPYGARLKSSSGRR